MMAMTKQQQLYVLIALKLAADNGARLTDAFALFAERNVDQRKDFWLQAAKSARDENASLADTLKELFDEGVVEIIAVAEKFAPLQNGISAAVEYLRMVGVD